MMGINRYVPGARQRRRVAGVINVTMGENDGFRRRARTETRFGGGKNFARANRESGANNHPSAACSPGISGVRNTLRQPAGLGRPGSTRGVGDGGFRDRAREILAAAEA